MNGDALAGRARKTLAPFAGGSLSVCLSTFLRPSAPRSFPLRPSFLARSLVFVFCFFFLLRLMRFLRLSRSALLFLSRAARTSLFSLLTSLSLSLSIVFPLFAWSRRARAARPFRERRMRSRYSREARTEEERRTVRPTEFVHPPIHRHVHAPTRVHARARAREAKTGSAL